MSELYGEKRQVNKVAKPAKKSRSKRPSFLWTFFKSCLVLGIWLLCFAGLGVLWFSYDLPDIEKLSSSSRKPSVTIQTQDGTVIGTYGDLYEDMVKISDLPPYVYQAVLAIEDRRFYHHFGIDLIGLLRAAYTNYQADRVVQGASTITQQLAKNFLFTQGLYNVNDRSLRRKIQEAIMALWLEWHFTKDQILGIYLNRVYLGSGTYGVDAAARKYYGRSANQLNVYQSAVIAGLLKAPSRYSPLSSPQRAFERAQVVLREMHEAGYIDAVDPYLEQGKQDLSARIEDNTPQGIKYFTDWVYEQIPNYVAIDQDLVVTTTLDVGMQKHAEKVCHEMAETMGKELKANQVALVAMTPDGGVKTMVGGKNYRESQFNRTIGTRQPGSLFKTFVYLAGLEAGLEPETMIDDTPVVIGNWRPSSFKHEAQGEVSMRYAFAKSVNPVTVRIGQMVTPQKIIEVANRLGITSKMTPDLSITLGSMDCSLMQLTSAFATFLYHGLAVWPYGIIEIKNKKGQVLYKRENKSAIRVIDELHLAKMRDLLNAVVKEGTGRAAKSAIGGKTGSNRNIDAWFIGFINNLVAGVWVGNDDNADMKKISVGGRMPTRVWEAFISGIMQPGVKSMEEEESSIEDIIASPSARPATDPTESEMESDRNIEDIIESSLAAAPAA